MNFLTASVVIKADTYGLKAELARAKSMVGRTMTKIRLSVNSAFDKMKRYARMAGLAIAASLVASLKAFASFDDAMIKSLAIMSGVTAKMRIEMEKVARSLALETTQSATEIAKAYFYLASAGLSAKQSIKALGAVVKFATAGTFDLSAATEMAVGSQAALGLSSKNAAINLKNLIRVTDVLVTANELSQATVSQFAEALTNEAAAAMKVWNIELEEGVAILAAYAKQNIKGAEGGSAFGRMLRFMMMGARRNREEWERFGLALYNAQGGLRPLADVVEDMTKLLQNMSVEQKGVTLELLGFQARSQQVILPLLGMSDAIRVWYKRLKEAGGHVDELSEKNLKSFSAQMKIAWHNIVDVAIAVGKDLAPTMRDLGIYVRENRDDIKELALSFLEVVGSVGKVIGVYVEFISKIRDIDEALTEYYENREKQKPTTPGRVGGFGGFGAAAGGGMPGAAARSKVMGDALPLGVLEIRPSAYRHILKMREFQQSQARETARDLEKTASESSEVLVDIHQETIDMMEEKDEEYQTHWEAYWEDLERIATHSMEVVGENAAHFASISESHLSDALTDYWTKAKTWQEAMESLWQDVLRSFIRMIADMVAQAIMFAALKAALGLGGVAVSFGSMPAPSGSGFPGSASTSQGMPQLAGGGHVERTGLAVIHRGEDIIPANASGGNIDVRIHNEGSENLTVDRAESYMLSDQRIIDVYIKAADSHGPFRRSMRRRG